MRAADLRAHFTDDSEVGKLRRLKVLNVVERHHGTMERIRTRRLARMLEAQTLKSLACDGRVAVIVWSRDCDHTCGESRYEIEATMKAYDEFRERQLDWAEGPMGFRLAHVATPFRGWTRDMALEAFEDGHPHSVVDAFNE